jgi:hypothetical protein
MSRLGFVAYGAGVAGVTLLTADITINSMIFVYRYAGGITALGAIGWLISSFGPIALSVFTWVIAQRVQARWLPHLIFIPLAIVAFKEGGALYFHESGILADSMASDFALLAATGYFVLAVFVHIVAFAASGIPSLRRWMIDS